MIEYLKLHGLLKSKQALYVQTTRQVAEYYRKHLNQITEEEIRHLQAVP